MCRLIPGSKDAYAAGFYLGWYTPKGTRRWTKVDEYYEADTTRSAGQHANAVGDQGQRDCGAVWRALRWLPCVIPRGRAHVIELVQAWFSDVDDQQRPI